MFSPDDTIVAIATPMGRGGIGVVRISGPGAVEIGRTVLEHEEALEPRHATLTRVRDVRAAEGRGQIVDEVIAILFCGPHSYTGQDVLEISAHGSPVVLDGVVRAAVAAGARLAQPGEFTLRAFLNGKRDLVQAEAVGDLIDAVTPLQARVAFDQLEGTLTRRISVIDAALFDLIARLEASLDFPDEGYHFIDPPEIIQRLRAITGELMNLLTDANEGRMIREGATVVIAGRTNVGKSSLFNALVGSERAIVTEVPGTTRDLVTERFDLQGLSVTLVDTAGAREALDLVEREGVRRGAEARRVADLVILVLDRSQPLTKEDETLLAETRGRRRVVVENKVDRPRDFDFRGPPEGCLGISVQDNIGIDVLRAAVVKALVGTEPARDTPAVSNMRHIALLDAACACLMRATDAATDGATEEFVVADLQAARASFDEIVGARTSEDILTHVFERFCIGK